MSQWDAMPAIDVVLIVGAAAFLISVAGWLGGKADKRRHDKEAIDQGIANARRLKQERERRCAQCDCLVDPAVDAYDDDRWWCRKCWAALNE